MERRRGGREGGAGTGGGQGGREGEAGEEDVREEDSSGEAASRFPPKKVERDRERPVTETSLPARLGEREEEMEEE